MVIDALLLAPFSSPTSIYKYLYRCCPIHHCYSTGIYNTCIGYYMEDIASFWHVNLTVHCRPATIRRLLVWEDNLWNTILVRGFVGVRSFESYDEVAIGQFLLLWVNFPQQWQPRSLRLRQKWMRGWHRLHVLQWTQPEITVSINAPSNEKFSSSSFILGHHTF